MSSPSDNIKRSPSHLLLPQDFDELEAILDVLRARDEEIPQWEFCEGFLAALVCCRRSIEAPEYLAVLLGTDGETQDLPFTDDAQGVRFMDLWGRRWQEVATALDAEVQSLEDEDTYHPEVMDVRGSVAALSSSERAELVHEMVPSFGQVWALGFMYAVESWPEEWAPPRDREMAHSLDSALHALIALTEDDTDEPTISPFEENGPPSVSVTRLNAFGDAIWAVYELRELWRSLGPRVQTVRKEASPGRNDLCYCGSGKKYKKCHGAS